MPTAEEFDEFYVSTRRDLLLQTFALTGDLVASRAAVRDAYVAARHHWAKLGRFESPLAWVRPRAWSRAQRRHTARPWHRERHIDADQAATLEALHRLKDAQRRTLVLSHLTDLGLEAIGREIGLPVQRIEELFDVATHTVVEALDCDPSEITGRLQALGQAVDTVKLPRPTIVRRNGLRRRRNFAVTGSIAIAAVMLGAGSFVAVGAPEGQGSADPKIRTLVSRSMLLTPEQIAPLSSNQVWPKPTTNNNNAGNGLNTICQKSRFADENGLGTLVRTWGITSGKKQRSLVQTVEISRSEDAAKNAYATTLGWYAGCTVARVQLVDAYDVDQVGDQAEVLRLHVPSSDDRSYVVGIARTGSLTTSTVLETHTEEPASAKVLVDALAASVRNLCSSKVAGECVGAVSTKVTTPPPSGETPGMLATADLPAVAKVNSPWAGTQPQTASPNSAATTCDKADFVKSGAVKPISRVFLIPDADLPARFGVTETIGRFPNARAASKFVNQVIARMKACPDKELSSTIKEQSVRNGTAKTPAHAYWRLVNQINQDRDEVVFWMGVTRVGPYVAQVTMTPVRQYDVSGKTFSQLLLRSHDRLLEVR
ncbi:DNA-directed RNA polymerase specialized sigma24 family protein [Marmoricola sp. OAE513]|uniref:hypothetical protein n=1 Tax=Marmoricola sp. OAE513 TaxID=2817894 RepID=UPI001DC93DEF